MSCSRASDVRWHRMKLCELRQVWDLAAGACVQTIDGAHDNVIMGLINWQVRVMRVSFMCIIQCCWSISL